MKLKRAIATHHDDDKTPQELVTKYGTKHSFLTYILDESGKIQSTVAPTAYPEWLDKTYATIEPMDVGFLPDADKKRPGDEITPDRPPKKQYP